MSHIKTKRALLVSSAIILLCMTIIVGATYSLFTDRFSVGNHLVAGELEISLQRTRLAYMSLDDAGYLSETVNNTVHDFTDRTSNNIFGLDAGNIRIAPGSYFEADLRVINDNAENANYYSNVAFTYDVTFVLLEGNPYLANQMQVTVIDHLGNEKTMRLDEAVNGHVFEAGTLEAGEIGQNFTVRVEFLDDVNYPDEFDNDLAKGGELIFDLVVSAVQATK